MRKSNDAAQNTPCRSKKKKRGREDRIESFQLNSSEFIENNNKEKLLFCYALSNANNNNDEKRSLQIAL